MAAPKRGSRRPKAAPEPTRRFLAYRVIFYVGICLNWLLRVAPGNGSRGQFMPLGTVPGPTTVWPIFFCCCGPFPKFMGDGFF